MSKRISKKINTFTVEWSWYTRVLKKINKYCRRVSRKISKAIKRLYTLTVEVFAQSPTGPTLLCSKPTP